MGWMSVAQAMQQVISAAVGRSPGFPTTVVVGWPEMRQVQEALRQPGDKAYISIYAPGSSVNTSRYTTEPTVEPINETEVVTVNGMVITIGGMVTPNDNIFLHINKDLAVDTYNVHVDANDTLNDLAAKLTNAVNIASAGYSATVNANIVTLASGTKVINRIVCRAFGQGIVTREVFRERQRFQLTSWTPNSATREAVSNLIVSNLSRDPFITMADGTLGRILYAGGNPNDFAMQAGLMTDIAFYTVEFPTFFKEKIARVGDLPCDVTRFGFDGHAFTQRVHVF